jgi:hypothetical protein
MGAQTVDREAADFVAARTALLPAASSQTTSWLPDSQILGTTHDLFLDLA